MPGIHKRVTRMRVRSIDWEACIETFQHGPHVAPRESRRPCRVMGLKCEFVVSLLLRECKQLLDQLAAAIQIASRQAVHPGPPQRLEEFYRATILLCELACSRVNARYLGLRRPSC